MQKALAALLSISMYVCAEGGGYAQDVWVMPKGGMSRPVRANANGWRLYPPDHPRQIVLGEAIGRQIRKAQTRSHVGSTHDSPRPHIRRAHWHGFLTGPRGTQRLEVRWLPPIAVAMTYDEDEDD